MSRRSQLSTSDFTTLRQRWTRLTTGDIHDPDDTNLKTLLQTLSATAQRYIHTAEITNSQIWPDLSPIHESVNFRSSYDRLRIVAVAYVLQYWSLSGRNEVLEFLLRGCDFIYERVYNESSVRLPGENWWNYRIGATLPLADIGVLLYHELGPVRREAWSKTITHHVGNIDENSLFGANRAHMCKALLGASLMIDDEAGFERARDGLSDVNGGGSKSLFNYVTEGEGFYTDGSFIAHHVYPYTGGYAISHLQVVADLAMLLQETPYSIAGTEMEMIYMTVNSTFLPVVAHGTVMGHVRGRNIARKSESDAHAGKTLLQSILQLSNIAPEPYHSHFQSLARYWEGDTSVSINVMSDIIVAAGLQLLTTLDILPPTVSSGLTIIPTSDRILYHSANWSAALAISSARTGRYETLNNENSNSFYQGDGSMYLYLSNDKEHYTNDYYPTMDPYHTPGVTAGQNPQQLAPYLTTGYEDWAGGVTWHDIGSASFKHLSYDQGSAAKKSWFFILNAIIALGAQCIGSSGFELHTTYESRNLQMPGTGVVIAGIDYLASSMPLWKTEISDPMWAHIDGVGGYIFLDNGNVTFERAHRTGKWTDIDAYPDYAMFDDEITREYLTIYRNHGIDPVSATYAYAILPNASAETTSQLSANPDFSVLSNTAALQAISLQDSNIYMATFWEPGVVGAMQAETPCSAVWGFQGVRDRYFTVTLADPSQTIDFISVIIDERDLGGLVRKDDGVQVEVGVGVTASAGVRSGVRVKVDCREGRGRTYEVVFERISWRGSPG